LYEEIKKQILALSHHIIILILIYLLYQIIKQRIKIRNLQKNLKKQVSPVPSPSHHENDDEYVEVSIDTRKTKSSWYKCKCFQWFQCCKRRSPTKIKKILKRKQKVINKTLLQIELLSFFFLQCCFGTFIRLFLCD